MKKKRIKPRLPMDAFRRLGSKKHRNKKAYDRKQYKVKLEAYCFTEEELLRGEN